MRMSEKIAANRVRAQRALDAYDSKDEDLAAIGDLIQDLLHLAESLHDDGEPRDIPGIADHAVRDYEYEADPDNADEEV